MAEVSLSASELSIEENLQVEVILSYPDTHTVDLDKLRINLLKYVGLSEPPFALIDESIETLPDGRHKLIFTLEPQLAGLQFVSLYDISFLPKDPKQDDVVDIISDIFKVTVTLPPVRKDYRGMTAPLLSLTQQFPISIDARNRKSLLENEIVNVREAQRNVRVLRQRVLPWAELTGVLLFVVILLIARMQPPRKSDKEKERRKRILAAQRSALKALRILENQTPVQEQEYDQYYMQITDAVKKYIEEKFQVQATTKTTQEFLHTMTTHPAFTPKTRSQLSELLIHADKVKFAEHKPTPAECQQAFKKAQKFISNH